MHQNAYRQLLLMLKVHEHTLPDASKPLSLQVYSHVPCGHVCMCACVSVCVQQLLFIWLRQAGRRKGKWTKSFTRTQGTYALFLAQCQVSCMTLYKSLILSCSSVIPCCKNFPSFPQLLTVQLKCINASVHNWPGGHVGGRDIKGRLS